ncbi:LysR family transcriptional regulator [Motiliproteus sp.]|uniref:LysR family transcriptional regulator n=1 Tax=Motiliproteus sp. TaxID=1898955 RepID=UPI003BAA4B21
MDSVLLRTFLEVAKTRHFGRAAENLYITHSAVSFRIRQLEDQLGAPLFHRKRNNLSLTVEGERLISYAESILATWNLALQDVALSKEQALQIGIGGTSNVWDTFLQHRLSDISGAFPNVSLSTEVDKQVVLVRAVLERKIDVGLVFDPPKVAGLTVKPVTQFELILVSHQDGVGVADISNTGYVAVDWGISYNVQQAKLFKANPIPILRTGQTYIARKFILSKGGSAYLPRKLVENQLQSKQLFVVAKAPALYRDVYAIYLEESDKAEVVGDIVNFLATTTQPPSAQPV